MFLNCISQLFQSKRFSSLGSVWGNPLEQELHHCIDTCNSLLLFGCVCVCVIFVCSHFFTLLHARHSFPWWWNGKVRLIVYTASLLLLVEFFVSFFFVDFLYSVYVQTKLTSTNLHIDTIQFNNNGGSKYIPFVDVEWKNGEESEWERESCSSLWEREGKSERGRSRDWK